MWIMLTRFNPFWNWSGVNLWLAGLDAGYTKLDWRLCSNISVSIRSRMGRTNHNHHIMTSSTLAGEVSMDDLYVSAYAESLVVPHHFEQPAVLDPNVAVCPGAGVAVAHAQRFRRMG